MGNVIPGMMIGTSVTLIAYWVFCLRLPDSQVVGVRRKNLPAHQKMLLSYARWLGQGVLDLVETFSKPSAKKFEKAADRMAIHADRPGEMTGVEVVGIHIMVPAISAGLLSLYCLAVAPEFFFLALLIGLPMTALLPFFWLNDRKNQRIRQIRASFPLALDLLNLCLEAGMDFTEGMKLLANRCTGIPAAVAKKRPDYFVCKLFAELINDIRMGIPRTQSLRRLEAKTGLPEIASFATALSLSDETGGNVADNLARLSSEMRNTRIMRAEEQIAKAPFKIMLPMFVFLFPIVLLVLFVPLIMNVMQNLG